METMNHTFVLPSSVTATNPAEHVSSRYKFVNTQEYIDAFAQKGWKVVGASGVHKRKGSLDHGKHMITMLHEDFDRVPNNRLGGLVPRVHLVNSHDWSAAFRLIVGMFRLVCSNGLMVSAGNVASASFKHHEATARDIANVLTDTFFQDVEQSMADALAWANIDLTVEQQMYLATVARNLRFGEDSEVNPEALLTPRREADIGNNLWLTFNRLQENTTKGGMRFEGMRRAARPLNAIDATIKVNTGLWNAAHQIMIEAG